ncbi:MAG: YfhO family protein [Vulcanimicrobiota bacterium]
MKDSHRTLLSLAVLFLCTLIFFGSFLFAGQSFTATEILESDPLFKGIFPVKAQNFQMGDITALVYPREQYYNHSLHEGKISLWDPHLFCGFPYLTDGRTGIFYPPRMVLHRFFSVETSLSLLMIFHILMAGAGMFCLARTLKYSHKASLLAGLVWAFSGTSTCWLEFTEVLYIGAYFPWIFLLLRKSILEISLYQAAAAGALLGLYHLVAQYQFSLYLLFFLAAYAVYAIIFREAGWRSVCLSALTAALFAGGISAVQMMPTLQMFGEAQRVAFTWKEIVNGYSVPFWALPLLFVCPDILGNPALGLHFFPRGEVMYHEICFYTGIISIPLAAAAAAAGSRFSKFLFFIIIISALCASATPFYFPAFTWLPFLNKMIPGRIVYLVTFAMALLATEGLDALTKSDRSRRAFTASSVAILVFYGILFTLTLLLQYNPRLFLAPLSMAIPHVQYPFHTMKGEGMYIEYLKAVLSYYNPLNVWLFLPAILTLVITALPLLKKKVSLSSGFLERSIVIFTAVELILFGLKFLPVTPRQMPSPPPHIAFLNSKQKPFRVLNLTGSRLNNLFSIFGIDTVQGSLSMYPRYYQRLMNEVESGFQKKYAVIFGNSIELSDYRSQIFDMLDVRYVIFPSDTVRDPGMKKVYQGDVVIYERESALPRAWLVKNIAVAHDEETMKLIASSSFSPGNQAFVTEYPSYSPDTTPVPEADKAEIASYHPDEIVIDAQCREKSLLVIADVCHSGWKAFVDGQPARICRTNYALRGVALGKGIHRVELRFQPDSFRIGLTVTVFFSAAFMLLTCVFLFRRWKRLKSAGSDVEMHDDTH